MIVYLQLALPLILILRLALIPPPGRARWGMVAATGLVTLAIGGLGDWRWPSVWAPYALALLWLVAALVGRRRMPPRLSGGAGLGTWTLMLGLMVAGAAGLAVAVDARLPRAATLDLTLPVTGRWAVTEGGGAWVNRLADVLDPAQPRLRSWTGQGYGLELTPVDTWGRPVVGDWAVGAPCAGTVVQATASPDDPVGPHVAIDCGGTWAVVAGLSAVTGSGEVAVGAEVGRATGPIRLHAQSPGQGEHPFSGDPSWVTVDGLFAVRGMVLSR